MKKIGVSLLLFIISTNVTWAFIGSETGNGGDSTAIKIKIIGQTLLSEIRYSASNIPAPVDIDKLSKSLETVKIETTLKILILRGKIKNAINYPNENRIIFNTISWRRLSVKEKRLLVLHELLGLNGIDDSDYKLSMSLEKIAEKEALPYILGKDKDCFDENQKPLPGKIIDVELVNIMVNSEIYSADDRENYCVITSKNSSNEIIKLSSSYFDRCQKIFNDKKINYKFRVVKDHICEVMN